MRRWGPLVALTVFASLAGHAGYADNSWSKLPIPPYATELKEIVFLDNAAHQLYFIVNKPYPFNGVKDFYIAKIVEEQSKVIGSVWYGMNVTDVIKLKGRHFKVQNQQEEGTAEIVYDDISIVVRQWWPGNNTGRVIGVRATSDQTKEYMKNIPYEDEK